MGAMVWTRTGRLAVSDSLMTLRPTRHLSLQSPFRVSWG